MNLISWIKNNKLAFFLSLIIIVLLFKNNLLNLPVARVKTLKNTTYPQNVPVAGGGEMAMESKSAPVGVMSAPQVVPHPEAEERMVVQTSNISLLVEDVRAKVEQMIKYSEENGGYMVSSNLSQPEEAPFATLVLRLPADKLKESLAYFRSLALRVISENLQGEDVTDQYIDNEARLETLYKTKAKFEQILNQASKIEDILAVQRELIYVQEQIDNLKGRQEYLKKTSTLAKLTLYLSEDEWSLPYSPQEPFRPKVIFKTAVRSLVLVLRFLIKVGIWVSVFSVIWLPALLLYKFFKKKKKGNKKNF